MEKSSDPLDLGQQAALQCKDGAFTVVVRADSSSASTPQSSGGMVQNSMIATARIVLYVMVEGMDAAKIDTDLMVPTETVIDRVSAALRPQAGSSNWNVTRIAAQAPYRVQSNAAFMAADVTYTVQFFWSPT